MAELTRFSPRERRRILDRILELDDEEEMLEQRRYLADEVAFQMLDALETLPERCAFESAHGFLALRLTWHQQLSLGSPWTVAFQAMNVRNLPSLPKREWSNSSTS